MKKVLVITRMTPVFNSGGSSSYFEEVIKFLDKRKFDIKIIVAEPLEKKISEISFISKEIISKCVFPFNVIKINKRFYRIENKEDKIFAFLLLIYTFLNVSIKYRLKKIASQKLFKNFNRKSINSWINHITIPFKKEEIDYILATCKAYRPDVIIANYVFSAEIFKKIKSIETIIGHKPKTIILTHDYFKNRFESFYDKNVKTKWVKEILDNENELFKYAEFIIAINNYEKQCILEKSPSINVICVPIPGKIKETIDAPVIGRCLFVGSNADHNVQGIKWFLEEVWPIVLQKVKPAFLHICGNVCRSIDKKYDNVLLMYKIPDLWKEYSEASVFIEPSLSGSGTKTKIVEALSYGKPIVTTHIGARGIEGACGAAVLIGDEEEGFANHIINILTVPGFREKMVASAIEYVNKKLNEKNVFKELKKILGI